MGFIFASTVKAAVAAVVLVSFAYSRLAMAQTPVSVCGTTLSAPGQYVLTGDLNCFGDGVFITANNVDLDLNGFTLTGQGAGAGINVGNYCATPTPTSGVRISNGQVIGFDFGVILCAATGARVSRLAVRQNVHEGIVLGAANNNIITGNRITDNGKGIDTLGQTCDNNKFIANEVSNNAIDGILLTECHNNRLAFNNVSNNGEAGIAIRDGTGNQILGNRANGNLSGILLVGLDVGNSTLRFNETNDNAELGIYIGGAGSLIERNRSFNNVIFDMNDEGDAFPSCPNTWRRNAFGTDEDDGGPGVGCIQ